MGNPLECADQVGFLAELRRHLVRPDEQVAALRAGTRPDLEAADLEAAYDVCQSILHSRAIGDDVYRQAVEALGEDLVVELMIVVGYYGMLAQLMNTFEVEPPA